jgi:hypothetical protein
MDLCARVWGTPSLRHHHPNAAITVAVMVAVSVASATASPSSGNNRPNNDQEAAMRAALSLGLQVADVQQHQWGGWLTSVARGKDNNGNNDHSVTAVALSEYLTCGA